MISIYFFHRTRTPASVRLAWHDMLVVPRAGERVTGPQGDWRIVEVRWNGNIDASRPRAVDIVVEDWEQ